LHVYSGSNIVESEGANLENIGQLPTNAKLPPLGEAELAEVSNDIFCWL